MATLTRAQLARWNSKLSNGYGLDVMHYLTHGGDKEAVKMIPIDGGKHIRAEFFWREVMDEKFRPAGYIPCLSISLWYDQGETRVSYGLGAWVNLSGSSVQRRSWDELAKYTAIWTDDMVLEEAKKHGCKLNDPVIAG